MDRICARSFGRAFASTSCISLGIALTSCGGGSTGSERDSGVNKTYLSVAADDEDGDTLSYQWRVTAGSIENRNSRETIWTMPDGPGLHFVYVLVSDGKGGWSEKQYAVASDSLERDAPALPPNVHAAPPVTDGDGTQTRLRFQAAGPKLFKHAATSTDMERVVYLPDVQVHVLGGPTTVFSGRTDLAGELGIPKLPSGSYDVRCAVGDETRFEDCGSLFVSGQATVEVMFPGLRGDRNLRLHGHVALSDGSVCGVDNAFFNASSAATVQLQNTDGSAVGSPIRVNRFGDYTIDAAVPVDATLKVRITCEGYATTLDVPASPDPLGYVSERPIELSYGIPNRRPRVVKVVANGANGNVRGQVVEEEAGAASNRLPGADHFLTYKGKDTRLSACMYYRALAAAGDCDMLGNMVDPMSFEGWRSLNGFGTSAEVKADYINQRDLNLVRRMVATRSTRGIAFYVCNHPGPEGQSQEEVNDVVGTALVGDKRVACVAMEYSATPGVNSGRPFTKFFTFGPDGALLLSINLDGRGEKFMPGTCVACHGGTTYNGRFPERKGASPFLGARFLPFDTGNFLFSTEPSLTEAAQTEAIYELNRLVVLTEPETVPPPPDSTALPTTDSATGRLVRGWYSGATHVLDKSYVPPAWRSLDSTTPNAAQLYRQVVATSCRTCHVALGANFDWDGNPFLPKEERVVTRVCGGKPELVLNASMPNALISGDRLLQTAREDAALAALMKDWFSCSEPLADPVYPRR